MVFIYRTITCKDDHMRLQEVIVKLEKWSDLWLLKFHPNPWEIIMYIYRWLWVEIIQATKLFQCMRSCQVGHWWTLMYVLCTQHSLDLKNGKNGSFIFARISIFSFQPRCVDKLFLWKKHTVEENDVTSTNLLRHTFRYHLFSAHPLDTSIVKYQEFHLLNDSWNLLQNYLW